MSGALADTRVLGGAAAFSVALCLAAEAGAGAACMPPEAPAAQVREVPGSGTIVLADGRRLALAGVASFSRIVEDEDGADRALGERLDGLLAGRQARIRLLDRRPDRYGRLPSLISIDTRLVQEVVAGEGLALAFVDGRAEDCLAAILAAESTARGRGSGFWARGAAVLSAEPGTLWSHLGRYVIFEGRVVSVGNRRQRSYLDFGTDWSRDTTVEIEAADRERFGGPEALAELAGRVIRVRGFLEESRGPMVRARWPGQIEIVTPVERGGSGPDGP